MYLICEVKVFTIYQSKPKSIEGLLVLELQKKNVIAVFPVSPFWLNFRFSQIVCIQCITVDLGRSRKQYLRLYDLFVVYHFRSTTLYTVFCDRYFCTPPYENRRLFFLLAPRGKCGLNALVSFAMRYFLIFI